MTPQTRWMFAQRQAYAPDAVDERLGGRGEVRMVDAAEPQQEGVGIDVCQSGSVGERLRRSLRDQRELAHAPGRSCDLTHRSVSVS